MYELDDDKICNDKYWVTLTENTHIKSSGEAAKILKRLESDGVLPKMQNHEWARLCIAFCFAKTKNIKDWEQKPGMDGGLEIASFNTCFNQNGKKGEEKFWLAYISQRMFDEAATRKFTKKHLFVYIQLAWHNGAKLLEGRYQKALEYCDGSIVEAKKIFFDELADLAAQHRDGGSDGAVPAVSGSLHSPNPVSDGIDLKSSPAANREMGEKIIAALQGMGKGVKAITFLGQGVRYDSYLVQFADYADWDKLYDRFCSAMGIPKDSSTVRTEQYAGLPHAHEIKILRHEDTWHKLEKNDFESALKQYHGDFLIPCCIGADEGGKAVFADLYEAPHILVGGTTRMGKSVLVSSIMKSLFELNRQDSFEVAIFDPAANYSVFKTAPNLWQGGIHGERSRFLPLLESLVDEMNGRLALLREYDAEKIQHLPEEYRPKLLIVLLEELAALLDTDKNAEKPIIQMLQEGAKTGIHMILVTQEPNSQTFSSKLLANLPSRIALRVVKPGSSRMILGEGGAEYLTSKGDHLVRWNGSAAQFLHGYNV
ncbi:cell division protein FtsK [Eikenella halliae]|uniref:Cell division protein FtsK n=2 Tax=Eikenella halliae TaxID=1795832 RepID=A0A1B6VT67_9NEIS|nr:cell division protein FtsK [Eikenella halliae]